MLASSIGFASPLDTSTASVGGATFCLAGMRPRDSRMCRRLCRTRIGLRSFATSAGPQVPHFLLRPEKIAIIRRIEIEKCSARGKVLDERFADCVGGT